MSNKVWKNRPIALLTLAVCAIFLGSSARDPNDEPGRNHTEISSGHTNKSPRLAVKIGNYFMYAPCGISIIVNDATAFEIQPEFKDQPVWDGEGDNNHKGADVAYISPGTTSPDFSYVQSTFEHDGATITFTWGRVDSTAVVGTLWSDKPVDLTLSLPAATWPNFHAIYKAVADGVSGYGITAEGEYIPFRFFCDPKPADVQADLTPGAEMILSLTPDHPTRFVSGVGAGPLPELKDVKSLLDAAKERYETFHLTSSGTWGNFLAAIPDNLNFSRLYSSDNGRVVHIVGRGWWIGRRDPNIFPYFAWDSFFNGILACQEDPKGARNTIRAVLSFQTPDGFIPLDSHWSDNGAYVTMDRSDPPVGALAVWKMNQRWPDKSFLAEVYPHLVKWHEWWMKARDGNHDGLLEWGSEKKFKQGAMWETGWDDNVEYDRAHMVGTTLNADAVDLNSLYSMDADYLGKIAAALGKTEDARRFEEEHGEMNRRINEHLWNAKLGMYCSRLWEVPEEVGAALVPQTVFKDGFDATYYKDRILKDTVVRRIEYRVGRDWQESSPARGVPQDDWSARWAGTFSPDSSGQYRFIVEASTGARLYLNGRKVIDTWQEGHGEERFADVHVSRGQTVEVVLEYFHDRGPASLQMSVHPLSPGKPGSDWLTRLTPMNFYPLAAGVPDSQQAKRVLATLYNKDKFWLKWLLPTVAHDDPVWPEQSYWHGNVWPPANYLVWLGLERYGDSQHIAEFARRCVELHMRNWEVKRLNCENYSSIDGSCNGDPHYTWGALLPLIGEEALVRIDGHNRPVPRDNPFLKGDIMMKHVPIGGKLYTIESIAGRVKVTGE